VGEVYPHNLLVEVGAELGILGLILLVGAVFAAVRMLAATRRSLVEGVSTRASLVIAMFVMAVTNSMLSGDIPTNSSLWLAMGVGLGLSAQRLEAKRLPVAWLPLEHPAPLQWR
jgi:O-antigen ligase